MTANTIGSPASTGSCQKVSLGWAPHTSSPSMFCDWMSDMYSRSSMKRLSLKISSSRKSLFSMPASTPLISRVRWPSSKMCMFIRVCDGTRSPMIPARWVKTRRAFAFGT